MTSSSPGTTPELLDLRGVACPLTFVRTRIALNHLAPGATLEVLLDEGEPAESVPRSCAEDGELILDVRPWEEPGVVRLLVARGEAAQR
ncbi:MAG TPA: sulfurtransferase TusA family protein [Candidatus Dormibacteraeota bacterium]